MPIFLGVHDFGKSFSDEEMEGNWQRYSEAVKKRGGEAWKVYYNTKEGKSWCITEADSVDIVNDAHNEENLPTKEVYEVKKLK